MISKKDLLKISPMNSVMRFRKISKFSHRFIGPFKILWCMREVVYELVIPSDLSILHFVFRVSIEKILL